MNTDLTSNEENYSFGDVVEANNIFQNVGEPARKYVFAVNIDDPEKNWLSENGEWFYEDELIILL